MKKIFSCSMSQVAVEKWNKYDQKLFEVVEKGDVGKVSSILSKKPIKASKINPKGQTTFHLAASRGLAECLNILLAHGVEINAKNDDGRTALHMAASSCQPECVKLLLERGANEDAVDFRGRTPLHCAASSGCVSSIIHLCEKEDISISPVDVDGKTPLMIAAQRNHPTVCSLLLEHGAQVNLMDKEGRTALILACERNNIQVVELLLANNANVMTTDHKGHNALYYTAHSHDDALRRLLCEPLENWNKGCDPGAEGSSQEIAEVTAGGMAQKHWDEAWQALPHEDWRWRYEDEHKKVLYLQAELRRKTRQLESSAPECMMGKDQIGEKLLEIHGAQQGRAEAQPGARKERDLRPGSSEDNDLLTEHGQRSLWRDMAGREGLEEGTNKLVKRYQEKIDHLQREVATAHEEMESARNRTKELEGHMDNMRAVISQFDNRKRIQSNMIEELQDQITEITGENGQLQALVKQLQGGVEVEDGKTRIMSGGITMTESTDAQAVLDNIVKELKQLLMQMRKEYANIQLGKQVLLKRQMEEVVRSHPQPELETMVREDFERSATFFKKTVADLEQLLTDVEQKHISLQEKSKQFQEMTGLSENEKSVNENASEVFVHSTVSEMQDWKKQVGKPHMQHPNRHREPKGTLQENAVLKDVRKLLQTSAPGIRDDASSTRWPQIIQQEERSTGKIQPLVGTEHGSLLSNGCVEMKDTVHKRIAELEKEVHDLRLHHDGLMTELTDTEKERDKLKEDLEDLQQRLQNDFLPRKEVQSLIEDLEKNFLLLSEELSAEQKATKQLKSKLEAQQNDILVLKESFPKEIMHEENHKKERTFSTDVLEELYWNIGTLMKKHDEAVMQKLKLEKENQTLKVDQSQHVPIKDYNELQRSMTEKIETQASEIQELSWKLSEASGHAKKLETELTSQKTNSISKWEHLQHVSTLDKDLTNMKGRLESAQVTVEEKCQEITRLNQQLDQASEDIQEMTSREKKCLQQHEKVISSLEKEIQKLKEDHNECISILDHNAVKTSMIQTIETQANMIQELEDKLTKAIKDQNAQRTSMTDKIDKYVIEIHELKHQLSKTMENGQQLQKELITQNANLVPNEKRQQPMIAFGKDPTTVKENLDPVREITERKDQDVTMIKHQPDQATEEIKEMTSSDNCLYEKSTSFSEKEIQKLKNAHTECVSILDHNAMKTSMSQTIEAQANVIQELKDKLTEAMKDVQELQKEMTTQKINSVPKKDKQGISLEKYLTEDQKRLPSSTKLLDEEDQVIEVQKQRPMEEGCTQDPKDITTLLEVENQRSAEGIQITMTHGAESQATEMEQLKLKPLEPITNVQETQRDPLRQKTNYVPYDEHLQHVTSLEEALTEVTDELELDKTKLDRQRQEIVMLKGQLDQAAKEIIELKSKETNGFHEHKSVESSLVSQVQAPNENGKALASKTKEIREEDTSRKGVDSLEMGRNENQIKEKINMEATLEQLQKMMDTRCDKLEDLASISQDREWKISELLDYLRKSVEEVMDLRNQNASFQQHLEETQKQHKEIVSIYRAHLLNAAQGFMDGDVHSTLSGILQMQSQRVC